MDDTHPRAQERYYELLAEQTPAERFASTRRLTSMVRQLAVAGIRQQNPHASDGELGVELARRLYGDAVAERLSARLLDG